MSNTQVTDSCFFYPSGHCALLYILFEGYRYLMALLFGGKNEIAADGWMSPEIYGADLVPQLKLE